MTPASSRALPKWALFGAVLLVSLMMSHDATAQSVIDQVMTQYSTAANTWITPLQTYAISPSYSAHSRDSLADVA